MDEDRFALVEKILKDVHNVLTKNAELRSFDIIPVESNYQNKSPVLHIENCLGIESWCVKHVYVSCYSELMDKYCHKSNHRVLKSTVMVSERLTKLLNITLLLNPDLTSLWNKRRELLLQGFLKVPSELKFSKLVLSWKPKCNDAFSYRRWILDAVFQDATVQSNYVMHLVNEELSICELASDKCQNNYHSWNHRMWTLDRLKSSQANLDSVYIKEYEFSERWTAKHVSDYSCYHYRQYCIQNVYQISEENYKILKRSANGNLHKSFTGVLSTNMAISQVCEDTLLTYSEDNLVSFLLSNASRNCSCIPNHKLMCRKLEILFHELVLNDELLRFYKRHETLWYHRRFIVHEMIVFIYEYYGLVRQNDTLVKHACKMCNLEDLNQKQAKIVRYDCNNVYSTVLFNVIMSHEKKFIEENRIDKDHYADRHENYLRNVEGLKNVM